MSLILAKINIPPAPALRVKAFILFYQCHAETSPSEGAAGVANISGRPLRLLKQARFIQHTVAFMRATVC